MRLAELSYLVSRISSSPRGFSLVQVPPVQRVRRVPGPGRPTTAMAIPRHCLASPLPLYTSLLEASPDLASPDLASPDLASPDLASPDLALLRDFASPDLASSSSDSHPDSYEPCVRGDLGLRGPPRDLRRDLRFVGTLRDGPAPLYRVGFRSRNTAIACLLGSPRLRATSLSVPAGKSSSA
jgi:hypothetical protein